MASAWYVRDGCMRCPRCRRWTVVRESESAACLLSSRWLLGVGDCSPRSSGEEPGAIHRGRYHGRVASTVSRHDADRLQHPDRSASWSPIRVGQSDHRRRHTVAVASILQVQTTVTCRRQPAGSSTPIDPRTERESWPVDRSRSTRSCLDDAPLEILTSAARTRVNARRSVLQASCPGDARLRKQASGAAHHHRRDAQ